MFLVKFFPDVTIFFVPFILLLSIVFTSLTHPLSAGIINPDHINFHFFRNSLLIILILLFLIFWDEMLVLFIFAASLASSESFKLSLTNNDCCNSTMSAIFMFLDPMFSFQPEFIQPSFLSTKDIPDFFSISTHFIYNFPTMTLTLVVNLYLLFTLIVVVEMTSVFSGPLRLSK